MATALPSSTWRRSIAALLWGALIAAPAVTHATALRLDNSGATLRTYVTFGDATALKLSNFTVETWFKRVGTGVPVSTGGGGIAALVPLVSKGAGQSDPVGGGNVDANYILGINTAGNVIAADFEEGIGAASPGLNHPLSGVTPIVNNTWYHA